MLIASIQKTLNELLDLVNQLSNEIYSKPCEALSNATIGEHTRHIIEMFQCLENQYENGVVDYDKRERNFQIQTDAKFASNAIVTILNEIDKPNKELSLEQCVDGEILLIQSNYKRELLYNLEHCIHHQALIKVALLHYGITSVNENFGVARSTIEYRKQCVQ
ncbi:DinB family protein [Flavobacterium capsici]|uniref:DinB family protein n=1 Tax=Flavobacterium capsici TaxID=3075618 RepID=A0AA96F2C6_9FLAO|nr:MULTISPECIES: DinB family protein [unclassified Flavobacterium]WNM20081.1 DinB family protein [Flavobacterium sp. PMR2A8]WNM21470.1 DinB family protein [Flavobacterium sp. PMTSA4]